MFNRLWLGHWRQANRRHREAGAAPAAFHLPEDERRAALLGAREVIVVLGDRLPTAVEGWLAERPRADSVEVLCRDSTDAAYLLRLAEQGHQLFDAAVRRQTLLFLDRRRCYRLPDWDIVPDAFSLACAHLWARTGCYARLDGAVSECAAQSRLFKLSVNESFWTWVTLPAGHQMPAVGARVKVLGISSWIGGMTTALIHGVLVLDEADDGHESGRVDPGAGARAPGALVARDAVVTRACQLHGDEGLFGTRQAAGRPHCD